MGRWALTYLVTTLLLMPMAAFGDPMDPRAAVATSQTLPPGAINELKAVEIGGIKQWISVRGADPRNPILLFIHGGPGSAMMSESWTFERPWEDYFTVVQWDQRGAGKTFATTGRKPDPAMTGARMQADAEEMIAYLRKTYGKDRIFVMGHSWGSILGLRAALHHPEWLYAYIGVGQVVNGLRGEAEGYREVLADAKSQNNQTAVHELEALQPYPGQDLTKAIGKLSIERKWDVALGGMRYNKPDYDDDAVRALSPQYDDADIAAIAPGERTSTSALVFAMAAVDFDANTKFDCPIFIFAGAHDHTTPATVVKSWFETIHAPQKRLFWIPNAAHFVVDEAPGVVLVDLVQYVRPLGPAIDHQP
jgi:pimeloyl-ACP methyl ester carboxylesterase